jgi:hypothetical protein
VKRVFLIVALVLAASPAYALEAEEFVWGFNGKAVPGRFNILSVLLTNRAERPYEGVLFLYRSDGLGGRRGAELVRPCFVSPYSSKWVQFYPYVNDEYETWVLRPQGAGTIEIPQPRLGAPAFVFLTDPDSPFARATALKVFPENLFPPTVTAADGLYALAIDHAPAWQAPRREAFLDWLHRGGIVHLFYGSSGKYPQFHADLSALNMPVEDFHVGAGRVVRHPCSRHEVTDKMLEILKMKGFAAPQLKESETYTPISKLEDSFFEMLGRMTKPRHNWTAIYLIIIGYLIVLGPVNYLFGRKRRNYWLTIVFFLVTVFCVGYVLRLVGHRGFGETALVHTVSYARPLTEDTYDVTQWTSVFVTGGDYYDITHLSPHNLYSTCQDYERVNGAVQNGRNGFFHVDIPMYSSRAFHHRGKMKGHRINLKVLTWEGDEELESLLLEPGPGFPEDVLEMYAIYRDQVYMLSENDGRIGITHEEPKSISEFFPEEELMTWRYMLPFEDFVAEDQDTGRIAARKMRAFQVMNKALIARSIGGTEAFPHRVEYSPLSDNRVQVFIYARSPEGFEIKKTGFGKETGYVLYHVDVFRPQTKGDDDGRDD